MPWGEARGPEEALGPDDSHPSRRLEGPCLCRWQNQGSERGGHGSDSHEWPLWGLNSGLGIPSPSLVWEPLCMEGLLFITEHCRINTRR